MILFFCLIAVVSCRSASNTSLEDNIVGRIVNGKSVLIEQYPYQLSLRYINDHICGASILTEQFAITAAHCTNDFNTKFLSIQYGITSLDDEDGRIVKMKRVFNHPEFRISLIEYDLAILELAEDIEFSDRALPIKIMETNESLVGEVGVVSGWGANREDADNSPLNDLQAVEIPIIDHKVCQEKYRWIAPITPRMFCAEDPDDGKDSCKGDSGGPFAVNGQLVGVVSWGYGCGKSEYPGVYANISVMIDFVKEVIGS